MSDQECPHGLDARWCGVCLHGVTRPEPAPSVLYRFTLKYDAYCPSCDLPLVVGQRAAKLSNGSFVHEGCAP